MIIGILLIGLQLYLLFVVLMGASVGGPVETVLVALAATVIVGQAALMFLLRTSERSFLAYPIGFGGLLLTLGLLAPLMLAI